MSSTRSNRLALSVLIGASLATSTGSVAASGADGSGAVIETTGDAATAISLPPAPTVGGRAGTATDIEVTITAGSAAFDLGLRIHSSTNVDEVDEDGQYVTSSTFEELAITSGADRIDPAAFDVLTGMTFRQTFAPDGRLIAVEPVDPAEPTNAQLVAFASITGNLQGAQMIYPDEPVGVGARWTVEQAVSGDSFPVVAEYQYALTAVEGGRYTMSVSYTAAFDTVVDGVPTAGIVSGLGSVTGSVDDPLDVSYRLGQTTEGTAGGNTVQVEVTVTMESTPE